MNSFGLPPGTDHRSWKGRNFRLDLMYSVAGVSTSMFLTTTDGMLLVDTGDGALRDMLSLGRKMLGESDYTDNESLEALSNMVTGVLITHPHFDHYAGLLPLVNFLQLIGRKNPLPVIYPEGGKAVELIADHYMDNLFEESLYDLDLFSMGDRDRINLGSLEIEARDTIHRDSRPGHVGVRIPAVGYSVRKGDERLVFSGDTGDAKSLKEFAEGADLLVAEATYPEPGDLSEGVHLTIEEALEAGSAAKELMLIHFTGSSYKIAKENKLVP